MENWEPKAWVNCSQSSCRQRLYAKNAFVTDPYHLVHGVGWLTQDEISWVNRQVAGISRSELEGHVWCRRCADRSSCIPLLDAAEAIGQRVAELGGNHESLILERRKQLDRYRSVPQVVLPPEVVEVGQRIEVLQRVVQDGRAVTGKFASREAREKAAVELQAVKGALVQVGTDALAKHFNGDRPSNRNKKLARASGGPTV